MEKTLDDALMKVRSYRSTIAAGFRLYTSNFRKFFKVSWLTALLYALMCACVGTLNTQKMPELTTTLTAQIMNGMGISQETLMQYATTVLALFILIVAALVLDTIATATILSKLKEHQQTGYIGSVNKIFTLTIKLTWRTLKGVFFTVMTTLIPILLLAACIGGLVVLAPERAAHSLITITCMFIVVLVIIGALILPLFHVIMKYVMDAPRSYFSTLFNEYLRAMRHWGYLFVVVFISTLVIGIASLFVSIPTLILSIAGQTAQAGQLMGDPLGMPAYMGVLTFATYLLISFLQFYITLPLLFHNYYIYGSIETQEQEREDMSKTVNQ